MTWFAGVNIALEQFIKRMKTMLIDGLIILASIVFCVAIPYIFRAIKLTWPQSVFFGGACILLLGGVIYLMHNVRRNWGYKVIGVPMVLSGTALVIYALIIAP